MAHQADAATDAQDAMGPLDTVQALQDWVSSTFEIQRQRHCVGGCALGSLVFQVAAIAALEGGLVLTQIQRSLAPLEGALTTYLDYVKSLITTADVLPHPSATG